MAVSHNMQGVCNTMDTHNSPPDYLTTKEIASTLGVHVQTVRRWIRDGRFETIKVGTQTIRISRQVLLRLTVANKVNPRGK